MSDKLESCLDGYEDLKNAKGYKVNLTKGTIINKKNMIMGALQNAGYIICSIPGHKNHLLHRILYEHKHGAIAKGMVIDHKDGNKTNNAIENLEAITQSENVKRAFAKLDPSKWNGIARKVKAKNLSTNEETEYQSLRKVCKELGVCPTSVRYCMEGKCKTAYSKTKKVRYSFTSPPASPPSSDPEPSSTEASQPLPLMVAA